MRALETYDPHRGYAFATYAMAWIRQAIGRHFENTRSPIRFPVYLQQLNRKYNKLKSDNPEQDDVFYLRLMAASHTKETGKKLSPQTILWCMKMNQTNMFSHIDDPENHDVLEAMVDLPENNTSLIDFSKLFKVLTYREKFILLERAEGMSLADCAACLNISRERVRQVQEIAIQKVRAAVRLKDKGYLFNNNQGRK